MGVLKEYLGLGTPSGIKSRYPAPQEDIQITGIEKRVAEKAFEVSEVEWGMAGKIEVRKLIWNLVLQGKLVPGTDTDPGLPFLTITPEGEQWLRDGGGQDRSIFFSSDEYLQRLESQGVVLGEVAESYLTEAINSYFNNCPRASMVMLGVAVEALFDEVDDAISETSNKEWSNIRLEPKNGKYSRRLEKFRKVIEPRLHEVTKITQVQKPGLYLNAILDHIRQMRNDGAHSALPNHDMNEAFAMLELFTRVAKIMVGLRDYLKNP